MWIMLLVSVSILIVDQDGELPELDLAGGKPGAHLAWVTGWKNIKDYGIKCASIITVIHYYE